MKREGEELVMTSHKFKRFEFDWATRSKFM